MQAPTTAHANDLKQDYDRDGFVVVRGLIPPAEIARIRQHAEGLVAAGDSSPAARFTQTVYARNGTVKLRKLSSLAEHDETFRALAAFPAIVDIVETLIGAGSRRFRDVMVVKPAHTTGGFSYHQDSAYWDVEPKALVSCWISLGDVAPHGSCLKVVPGSHHELIEHRLYLRGRHGVPRVVSRLLRRVASLAGTGDNPEASGSVLAWKLKRFVLATATRRVPILFDLQDFRIPPADVDAVRERLVPVQAGDAVFFHSLTWHATGANESDHTRYSEIVSYMGADAQVIGADAASFPLARIR